MKPDRSPPHRFDRNKALAGRLTAASQLYYQAGTCSRISSTVFEQFLDNSFHRSYEFFFDYHVILSRRSIILIPFEDDENFIHDLPSVGLI